MKIRTQFILSMLFFGLIVLAVIGSIGYSEREFAELDRDAQVVFEARRGASDLTYLANDYVLYGEPAQRARWDARWEEIAGRLGAFTPHTSEEGVALDAIAAGLERSRRVFDAVADSASSPARRADPEAVEPFIQMSWSRMAAQNQSVAVDADWLLQLMEQRKDGIHRQNMLLTGALIAAFTGYFAVNYGFVYRRMLASVTKLQAGAATVGSGDLSTLIPVSRRDEMGELAMAFNRMIEDLREVTASKAELEAEIFEREAAEAAIARHNAIETGINTILRGTLSCASEEDLGRCCVHVAETITGSTMGMIDEIGDNGRLRHLALGATALEACDMANVATDDLAVPESGLLGRVLSTGEPVIANDPPAHPDSTGGPEGHPKLENFLGVPLVHDGETIGILGVANRPGGYTNVEKEALETIAPAIVEAFQRMRAEAAVRDSESRLRLATDAARLGVFAWDFANDTVEWHNERVYELFERSPAEGVPTSREILGYLHPEDRHVLRDLMSREVRAGYVFPETFRVRRRNDRGWRWLHAVGTFEPTEDGSSVARMFGFLSDITEQKQSELLTRALDGIRCAATSTFAAEEIVSRVADAAVDALEAKGACFLLRDEGRWTVDKVYRLGEEVLGEGFSDDERFVTVIASRERKPIAVEDAANNERVSREFLRRLGAQALLTLPVIAQGRIIGGLSFYFERPRAFSDAEIDFGAGLMNALTLALDNADAYQREHIIADTLQQAILAPAEDIEGLTSAYLYRAATSAAYVGGDFYDLFEVDGGRVVILVGDVSGKGLEAARLTSLIRDGVRAYAYETSEPGWVLHHLNHLVYRASPMDTFATLFYGTLDPSTGRLSYCCAGHPPAAVIRSDRVELITDHSGAPVGAFSAVSFDVHEATLEPGDVLVLYTDGVTEARRNGSLFGPQRLAEALESLRGTPVADLPSGLLAEVLEFSGGEMRDDTAILCIARTTSSESAVA